MNTSVSIKQLHLFSSRTDSLFTHKFNYLFILPHRVHIREHIWKLDCGHLVCLNNLQLLLLPNRHIRKTFYLPLSLFSLAGNTNNQNNYFTCRKLTKLARDDTTHTCCTLNLCSLTVCTAL